MCVRERESERVCVRVRERLFVRGACVRACVRSCVRACVTRFFIFLFFFSVVIRTISSAFSLGTELVGWRQQPNTPVPRSGCPLEGGVAHCFADSLC